MLLSLFFIIYFSNEDGENFPSTLEGFGYRFDEGNAFMIANFKHCYNIEIQVDIGTRLLICYLRIRRCANLHDCIKLLYW